MSLDGVFVYVISLSVKKSIYNYAVIMMYYRYSILNVHC